MSFPGSGPEVPDAYIERNPYDEEHDPDAYEVCPVCDRIACACEPEEDPPKCAAGCGKPALDGHMICGLAGCNEGAHRIGNQ
jgi:hypothetical protein